MKKRIAIDMDEVIADVTPKFLDIYQETHGYRPVPEEYLGKKLYQLPGAQLLREKLFHKGFFADLNVMPHSQEVVRELQENFDVFIVTAAMEFRNSFEDKFDWMQQHFPFIHWKNIIFCGDKSIIQAEFMIDDHAFNLEKFSGTPLLFTASHNIHENRFTRLNDWLEVRAYFKNQ